MNDNVKIKLDMTKLYGFKIVQRNEEGKCIAPKIGDGKIPPAPALSSKIGGKVGAKTD